MAKKQKAKDAKIGRPTEIDAPTRKVYLTLDEHTIEKAGKLGGGNISAGVRIAVKRVKLPAA